MDRAIELETTKCEEYMKIEFHSIIFVCYSLCESVVFFSSYQLYIMLILEITQ